MNRRAAHIYGVVLCALLGLAAVALTGGIWLSTDRPDKALLAPPPELPRAENLVAMAAAPLEPNPIAKPDEKGGAWGNVKGQIVLDAAAAPEPAVLQVDKDQAACLAKGPLTSEDLIVNKGNMGIKNVFVWLLPIDPEKPFAVHPDLAKIKDKEVVVDQPCCMFVPHALWLRQGQTLVAKNSSAIAHNFHWTGYPLKNPGGNSIIPAGGDLKIADLMADRLPVKLSCDIHTWMTGWVRILDHPYFALTDAEGKFDIKNVPAGPCRIAIWQEKKGWVADYGKVGLITGKEIAIAPGKTVDLGVVKMGQPKE